MLIVAVVRSSGKATCKEPEETGQIVRPCFCKSPAWGPGRGIRVRKGNATRTGGDSLSIQHYVRFYRCEAKSLLENGVLKHLWQGHLDRGEI